MKKKRLIIILSIFGALTLLVIICSSIFTVQNISVNWLQNPNYLSSEDNNSIIDGGSFKKGESVFFTQKDKHIKNIEKAVPRICVESIETVFPNKLVIHVYERTEFYAFELGSSSSVTYAITDENLKVLDFINDRNEVLQRKLNIVEASNLVLNETLFERGHEIAISEIQFLKDFAVSLFMCDLDFVACKEIINTLTIQISGSVGNSHLLILTNYGDLKIDISNYESNILNKVVKAIEGYNACRDANPTIKTGIIHVFEDESGEVKSTLEP